MPQFDRIENTTLVFNGLEHIEFEFARPQPSYFRIARESHLVLYRSMIECLRGTNNIAVTLRPNRKREHTYQFDSQPIKKIFKQTIPECAKAWRFSDPTIVDAFLEGTASNSESPDDFLIPFYDALAMIQAECFMLHYGHSKVIPVSNEEMNILEWLHEAIRNEYEHFVPKLYSAPVSSLLAATDISIDLANKCLFESGNVHSFLETAKIMKRKFNSILAVIKIHQDDTAA